MYNKSQSITTTIHSVLVQKTEDIEIILIDDGSTDGSIDIVRENFETKKSQISYYHQTNSGVSSARNNGLKVARSDYVLFLDADDLLDERFFSCLNPFLNNNYDLILYNYAFIKNEISTPSPMGITDHDGVIDINYELENYFHLRRRRMRFHLSSMVFR